MILALSSNPQRQSLSPSTSKTDSRREKKFFPRTAHASLADCSAEVVTEVIDGEETPSKLNSKIASGRTQRETAHSLFPYPEGSAITMSN